MPDANGRPIIALTGHRPNKLWGYNTADAHYQVVRDALKETIRKTGAGTVISGMALGFDQLGADVAASDPDLRLVAAIPFRGQESKWPYQSRHQYYQLLDKADEQVIVSDGEYSPKKMMDRNRWMVDHADIVVALWDGTPGGTKNCVDYAVARGKNILRLDPQQVEPGKAASFETYSAAAPTASRTRTPQTRTPQAKREAKGMRFRGDLYFLSNMYPTPIEYQGRTYTCVESAFQAAKCAHIADRARFEDLDGYAARKLGRQITLRADWNSARLGVMRDLLEKKFSDPTLASKLSNVQGPIAEWNDWNDRFWGVVDGRGENHLGRMLTEIRDRQAQRQTSTQQKAPIPTSRQTQAQEESQNTPQM